MKRLLLLISLLFIAVCFWTACSNSKNTREKNPLNDEMLNDSISYRKALRYSIEEKLLPKYKTKLDSTKK